MIAAGNDWQRNRFSVELYLKPPHAKPHFYLLRDRYRDRIESALGPVEWLELPNRKASSIGLIRVGTSSDPASWPAVNAWMADTIEKMTTLFRPIVRTLDASEYGGTEDTTGRGDSSEPE